MDVLPTLHTAPVHESLNQFFKERTSVEIDNDASRSPEDCSLVYPDGAILPLKQLVDPVELRDRLDTHGVRIAKYWRVSDAKEIDEAAIGNSPVVLRMGTNCRYVQFAADVGLRYGQLRSLSDCTSAIVEKPENGSPYWVLGLIEDGVITFQSVVDLRWLSNVFQFPMHLKCPSGLNDDYRGKLGDLARCVVDAMELSTGPYRIECILSEDGHAVVTEVDTGWFSSAMPVDLFAAAGLGDYWAMQCRALGIKAADIDMIPRSVSLQWLYSRSGIVEEIAGIDDALALPGVDAVRIHAHMGMALGHVIDVVSRDRLGYVVASGATKEEADVHCAAGVASIKVLRKTIL